MAHQPKLIIACDALSRDEVEKRLAWIKAWCPELVDRILFKVNDLLLRIGLDGVKQMVDTHGISVMLDPKTDDIPTTIANNLKQLSESGIGDRAGYYTIKASAGFAWMKRAVEQKAKLWLTTKLLAITVLTSMKDTDSTETFNLGVNPQILQFARLAVKAGMDGFVCSPLEVDMIKDMIKNEFPHTDVNSFEFVTPWMRFDDSPANDQARIGTPESAVENRAQAVMGRPILGDVEWGKPYTIEETIAAIRRFMKITDDKARFMHNQE